MKNELTIVQNIEKRLMKPNAVTVFPLTPTHRKELRELKRTNIGGLRSRLQTIQSLKREEYVLKYKSRLIKEIQKKEAQIIDLNKNWLIFIQSLENQLDKRLKLEKQIGITESQVDYGYSSVAKLKLDTSDCNRVISLDSEKISVQQSKELFNEKYKGLFQKVGDKIEDIETKYEEAINFGDLEIVKELYYYMKTADDLFIDIVNLKV